MSKPCWCPNCKGGIVSLLTGYKCDKCGRQYNYFNTLGMVDLEDKTLIKEFEASHANDPLPKSFRQVTHDGGRTWETIYDKCIQPSCNAEQLPDSEYCPNHLYREFGF
jgi:hypothetical protein